MSLCIASASGVLTVLASSFTLSWTHSVEKTTWTEHWQTRDGRLALTSASVEGPGAGIDLPPDAIWAGDRWVYRPKLAPISTLHLAASGATSGGWQLCANETCYELGAAADEDVQIWTTTAACGRNDVGEPEG